MLVQCPNYHSVIPTQTWINQFYFVFVGDGDDNKIFKEWNKAIERFKKNDGIPWYDQDRTPWSDSKQLER